MARDLWMHDSDAGTLAITPGDGASVPGLLARRDPGEAGARAKVKEEDFGRAGEPSGAWRLAPAHPAGPEGKP